MFKYRDYSSTPHIHLPRSDPIISSYGSSLASALPWYRVHKWVNMPPVLIWLPAVSECTPVCGVIPRLLVPPPPGDIPTPLPPHILPSSPWSVLPPDGETPPGPSKFPPYHVWRPSPTLGGLPTTIIAISGGVPEPEESTETVGDDFDGVDEDGSNSAGPCDDEYDIGTVSSAI